MNSIATGKALNRLTRLVHHGALLALDRARDPLPEMLSAAQNKTDSLWKWFPTLTLINAAGMLSLAIAYTSARYGAKGAEWFFWIGLLLAYVPISARLISCGASRIERLILLCLASAGFFLVDAVARPFYLADYDVFVHWRTAEDIAGSHHLFTANPLLPVSPFYPGLEIVTNALSTISGLGTFNAGILVIGVARLMLLLSLFMLYEYITKSARVAGIASTLYMSNPHFLFFDALFSYESLALPLATLVLFAVAYPQLKSERRRVTIVAWIILASLVITHHMTDYVLDGFLVLWTITAVLQNSGRPYRSSLIAFALSGVLLAFIWAEFSGNPVIQKYLLPYFTDAVDELGNVLTGTGQARQLFVAYAGQSTPLAERIIAITSTGLVLLCLPFGLLCLWQRYRSNALASAFGIATLFYPLSQLFRLTNAGSEIADRATAFLFIPMGFVLAIFITQFWPTQRLNWQKIALLSCGFAVLFLGGVIVGSGPPWARLPGPYLVAADTRSIEPEGIQAALWTGTYLGPHQRVGTDRTNRLLMSIYGDQRVITSIADDIDITSVFLSLSFGPDEIAALRQAQIRYLVVDRRLSLALPGLGFYFEQGEPGSYLYTRPISLKALTKFTSVPQIDRIFDSGNIVIYDVEGIINAPQKP